MVRFDTSLPRSNLPSVVLVLDQDFHRHQMVTPSQIMVELDTKSDR